MNQKREKIEKNGLFRIYQRYKSDHANYSYGLVVRTVQMNIHSHKLWYNKSSTIVNMGLCTMVEEIPKWILRYWSYRLISNKTIDENLMTESQQLYILFFSVFFPCCCYFQMQLTNLFHLFLIFFLSLFFICRDDQQVLHSAVEQNSAERSQRELNE